MLAECNKQCCHVTPQITRKLHPRSALYYTPGKDFNSSHNIYAASTESFMAKVSTHDFFSNFHVEAKVSSRSLTHTSSQTKKLKVRGHLQFWWPSGLVPCVWNPMIMQTWVWIPKSVFVVVFSTLLCMNFILNTRRTIKLVCYYLGCLLTP